jgi:hypothetical protein
MVDTGHKKSCNRCLRPPRYIERSRFICSEFDIQTTLGRLLSHKLLYDVLKNLALGGLLTRHHGRFFVVYGYVSSKARQFSQL